MVGDASDSLHEAYFETEFRLHEVVIEWPGEFVIVSAYATTGERWTDEQNEQADRQLGRALREMGVWTARLDGFSRDTGHSEPSYAAELSLDDACELGLRLRQDAIYHVRGDVLSVTHCDERRHLVPVGPFRARVTPAA